MKQESINNQSYNIGNQKISIRPITFFIGENNTGKTSAMIDIQISKDDATLGLKKKELIASSRFLDILIKFGRDSGLFSNARWPDDRRQHGLIDTLQIKITDKYIHFKDLGKSSGKLFYTILSLYDSEHKTLFFTNPENYQHPKVQASLCSLFVEEYKKNNKHFIIETHSDSFIDRIMVLVRQKKISPEDVSIVYFEKTKKGKSKIHNITLDAQANLLNVPKGYRDFFLNEGYALLGIG